MPVIYAQPQQSGLSQFTQALNPYLQMAMQAMLQRQIGQPTEKRAERKEARDITAGIAKGEIPIGSSGVPESLRKSLIQRSIGTQGLTGLPQNLQAMQNISPTAQISGTPGFMRRLTTENPQQAQQRMMKTYATQQQAISPYRALAGQKLSMREQIDDLITRGAKWEDIPIFMKLQAGYKTPPKSKAAEAGIDQFVAETKQAEEETFPVEEAMPVSTPEEEQAIQMLIDKGYTREEAVSLLGL